MTLAIVKSYIPIRPTTLK